MPLTERLKDCPQNSTVALEASIHGHLFIVQKIFTPAVRIQAFNEIKPLLLGFY